MRDPTAPFDDGYDICDPQATRRAGKKSTRATIPVSHRPAEGMRLYSLASEFRRC